MGRRVVSPAVLPETVRIDEDLGEEVNRRLVAWAERVGLHEGRMKVFSDTGYGRLAMLTHPDTDDPDMLLIAAQTNAAWWAADDYYADETDLGATPTELPPRLALVMSAMDPPPPVGDYTRQLEETIQADPVLVSLRSSISHISRHATPSQIGRVCNITSQMYVSWAAYAAWRYLETPPPVWRYLAARQHDSFYTSMTLIDIVGGYQLPADLFFERRFHTALMQAGTASVLVNDLYSVEKEAADELPDSNVILLIAAEEKCSIREATERAIALHNGLVTDFESSHRALAAVPCVELQRFLRGAQAWMGRLASEWAWLHQAAHQSLTAPVFHEGRESPSSDRYAGTSTVLSSPYQQSVADYWNTEANPVNLRLGDVDGIYHHHYGIGDVDWSVLDGPDGGRREDRIIASCTAWSTRRPTSSLDHLGPLGPTTASWTPAAGAAAAASWPTQRFGCRVDGVSISEKQVDFANEQAGKRGVADKVRFHLRNMLDTGFESGAFQAIWNNESTMYVDLSTCCSPSTPGCWHAAAATSPSPAATTTPTACRPGPSATSTRTTSATSTRAATYFQEMAAQPARPDQRRGPHRRRRSPTGNCAPSRLWSPASRTRSSTAYRTAASSTC